MTKKPGTIWDDFSFGAASPKYPGGYLRPLILAGAPRGEKFFFMDYEGALEHRPPPLCVVQDRTAELTNLLARVRDDHSSRRVVFDTIGAFERKIHVDLQARQHGKTETVHLLGDLVHDGGHPADRVVATVVVERRPGGVAHLYTAQPLKVDTDWRKR